MQNGVASERAALRRFANLRRVRHCRPAPHAWASCRRGRRRSLHFESAATRRPAASRARRRAARRDVPPRAAADVMLGITESSLTNLARGRAIWARARRGRSRRCRARRGRVLAAAGIDHVSEEEMRRSATHPSSRVDRRTERPAFAWQSLERRAHGIETDYLNG